MKGTLFVIILFLIFTIQWEVKRRWQMKKTGHDPDVFGKATTPLQKFISGFTVFMTVAIVALIACHGLGIQWHGWFSMFGGLDSPLYDTIGFLLGLSGLALALYAQVKMGASWRVGIDETEPPALVTDGVYRFIRNPTYLGIYLLLGGVWVILPTWSIALFSLFFWFLLEVQVRCEEEYLAGVYGDRYREYTKSTRRYIPFVY